MYPNIDLRLVRDGSRGLLYEADRLFAAAEVPLANAANRGWLEAIYQRAQSEGVHTLLSGEQGNLTVSWDGSGLLPELLRTGRFDLALREARATVRAGRARSVWRAILRQGLMPLLPSSLSALVESRRRAPGAARDHPWGSYSLIAPTFAAELHLLERDTRSRTRLHGLLEGDGRAQRLRVLTVTASQSTEIFAGYRAMFGIDTRVPLADKRLVEFCLQLPEAQYARAGEDRLLIRRAMNERVAPETLRARKRGLQAAAWFDRMSRERSDLLAEVTRFETDELTSRVLDLPRLRRLLETWPSHTPTGTREVALYRGAIGTAMMTGAFIRWAGGG
jgi:asparagine synthase (glutamine-hydrolysing)